MGERDSLETPSLELRIGRLFFALALLASGLLQLVTGRFVTLVPLHPGRMPSPWPPYFFGALLVLIAVAFLVRKATSIAAITLAVLLLILFFGFGLRAALTHASTGFVWVDPLMTLTLVGGAVLAPTPRHRSPSSSLDRLLAKARRFAPLPLAAFLAFCGLTHFPYAKSVATLIPPWIPGHLFWTYFAGIALIAGGIGILVPRTARLAATLSGIMLFSWVFLVHLPLAIKTQSAGEISRIFEALADSSVAFMLAGSVRRPNE